jgi:hypothetical protein
MAVTVITEPDFSLEKPEILFRGDFISVNVMNIWRDANVWNIHPDGQRFLTLKQIGSADQGFEAASPCKINVIVNLFEELKDRVPAP